MTPQTENVVNGAASDQTDEAGAPEMLDAALSGAAIEVLHSIARGVAVRVADVRQETVEELRLACCVHTNDDNLSLSTTGKDRLYALTHEGWRRFLESNRSITV